MLKLMRVAMAVGVLAALALPSSASANFKHHGVPIQENVDIQFTGTTEFTSNLGGIRCQIRSTFTFFANQTTGLVDSYQPHPTSDTANCTGTGGLAFCQVHNMTPTELPWTFHTTVGASTLSVTHGEIHYEQTGGFCPIKKVTITPGTIIATPNQPNTFTSIQLSGAIAVHLETTNGTQDTPVTHAGGTLTISEGSKKHTYVI